MIESLTFATQTPGFPWLLLLSLAAGLVYGFAGFGAALIFMPVAIVFLAPPLAVAAFSLSSLGSVVTVLPQAWRDAHRKTVLIMLGAALIFTPLGLWVLRIVDPTIIRWAVSVLVFLTLAALIMGWRYKTQPGPKSWAAVGSGVGLVGGATGLNGPVVILFQLAGTDSIARTRANTIVVLTLSSLSYMPFMALQGALPVSAIPLGLLLVIPYALGGLIGRQLFDPNRATLYRRVAYVIIAAAGVLGLPIFG